MKYDFTSIPDRSNCGSSKWDAVGGTVENVPLSVADMEFPTAPAIKDALKNLVENTILGYACPTEEYFDATISWMKRRHNFDVKKEWFMSTPGVIPALSILIQSVTKPGDAILLLTPVYYPFDMVTISNGRRLVYSPLVNKDGRYEIDYDDLTEKAKMPEVKAILFSNPHNPVSRVWTRDELEKVGNICCDNGVFIISDEIHNDLIMKGVEHTVFANVSERIKDNCAVCTAPSKTFNLAGVQCSNAFIPNDKIRARVKTTSMLNMNMHLNIFAYEACKAAYNHCEDWLDELLDVIKDNAKYVEDFMAEHYPQVKCSPLEGTYLQWIDVRGLGLTHVEMRKALEGEKLFLDNGEMFGEAGRGYQRINLACARETLEKAMAHFKSAVDKVLAGWKEEGKPYHKTLSVGDKVEGFVYNTTENSGLDLAKTIKKPTLIAFLRFAECDITKAMLSLLKKSFADLGAEGVDVKAVVQSCAEDVKANCTDCPFEIIADGEGKLYDRFNVFESNSAMQLVAGDEHFAELIDGDVRHLYDNPLFDTFAPLLIGDGEYGTKRVLQLPAFIGIDTDMTVKFAHYSKTIGDLPETKAILDTLKK